MFIGLLSVKILSAHACSSSVVWMLRILAAMLLIKSSAVSEPLLLIEMDEQGLIEAPQSVPVRV